MNCLVWPYFNLTIAANKLKESKLGAYLEAVLNVIFSISLVFWNPLVGIAIGTLISAIFKSIYYVIFASKSVLKINPFKALVVFLATSAVLAMISICGILMADILPIYNYWNWIVAGVITVIITGIVGLIMGCVFYPEILVRSIYSIKRKT